MWGNFAAVCDDKSLKHITRIRKHFKRCSTTNDVLTVIQSYCFCITLWIQWYCGYDDDQYDVLLPQIWITILSRCVPPIHAVSSHVATDKSPSKFRSIFSNNLQPIATRGKKACGTLLVDIGCSSKRAPLSVSYYNEVSSGHIGSCCCSEEGLCWPSTAPVVVASSSKSCLCISTVSTTYMISYNKAILILNNNSN